MADDSSSTPIFVDSKSGKDCAFRKEPSDVLGFLKSRHRPIPKKKVQKQKISERRRRRVECAVQSGEWKLSRLPTLDADIKLRCTDHDSIKSTELKCYSSTRKEGDLSILFTMLFKSYLLAASFPMASLAATVPTLKSHTAKVS